MDLRERIYGIKIPTLVIYYKSDSLLKNEEILKINGLLKNCKFFSSGLEGHFANPDDKIMERKQILDFLKNK